MEGHTLGIHKLLYGILTSGLLWHKILTNIQRSISYIPSRAQNDIWMRKNEDARVYMAVYVYYLATAEKDLSETINTLKAYHKQGKCGRIYSVPFRMLFLSRTGWDTSMW
jgi:hypothetical protein